MTTIVDDTFQDISPEFYELVGRSISNWACLEALVNDCIWAMSGTPYGAGACITAQIYTLNGRLSALLALLKLRNVDPAFIAKINKFAEETRSAAEKRNRIAHDMWGSVDGEAWQLVIKADKKLQFQIRPRTLDELDADHKHIEDTLFKFVALRDELDPILKTLTGTQPLALRATYHRHDRKQNQAKPPQSPDDPPQSSRA